MCREGQAMHRDRQRRCGELRETNRKTERQGAKETEKVKFRETVRNKDRVRRRDLQRKRREREREIAETLNPLITSAKPLFQNEVPEVKKWTYLSGDSHSPPSLPG